MENNERITPQRESEWDPEIRELFERMGYQSEDDLYNILRRSLAIQKCLSVGFRSLTMCSSSPV